MGAHKFIVDDKAGTLIAGDGPGSLNVDGLTARQSQPFQKLLLNEKQTIELMRELGADLIQNLQKTPQNSSNIPEMGISRLSRASCARAKRWRGDLMHVRLRSRAGRCV